MVFNFFYCDITKLLPKCNCWIEKSPLTPITPTLTCSPGSRAQQLGPRHVGWHAFLSPQVLPHSSPHVTAHLEGCRGSSFSMRTLILWPSSSGQTTAARHRMCRKWKSKLKLWSLAPLKWAFRGKRKAVSSHLGWKRSLLPVCGRCVWELTWGQGLSTTLERGACNSGKEYSISGWLWENQQTHCQGQETVLWDLLSRKASEWNGWVCDRSVVVKFSTQSRTGWQSRKKLQSDIQNCDSYKHTDDE